VAVRAGKDGDPAAYWEHQGVRQAVLAAISSLPESQRVVTVLVYIDGYSQQEVVAFLEVSLDMVKKRLERARRQLGSSRIFSN
jgi:RNA polymerase sigma-70 factor (ECF subfamily)